MLGTTRKYIVGTLGLIAVAIIATVIINPDLALLLRAQVPPSITRVEKTVTWTPSATETPGERQLSIIATDNRGGTTSRDITVTVEGGVDGITDIEVVPSDTQAIVRWKTTGAATPRVDFDVSPQLREYEQDSTEATDHEIVIPNLVPCTTYGYRVRAVFASQTVDGVDRSFTTSGCTGGAAVNGVAKDDVPAAGKTVSLPNKATVVVPAGVFTSGGHVQIHQLDRDQALGAIAIPEDGLSAVTGLYEVGMYSDATTKLDTVSQPVSVTLAYTPGSDTDTSTLSLWRYSGGSWSELDDCSVDTSASTVTCSTTQFSAVAGFATGSGSGDEEPEPTPTPTPSQQSSGGGDSGGDDGGGDSGGGGGGGGDDGGSSTPAKQTRTYTYQTETVHKVEGPYSGIVGGPSSKVAKLASGASLLSKHVTVPTDDYWLDLRVKHDKPGPVNVAIYLNNRAWKVIRLTKADNKYYTHRVGLLRNFRDETIRFRLLNDDYNKAAPTDEEQDRNLFIDWWRLTTDENAPANAPSSAPASGTAVNRSASGGAGSTGTVLLPNLNSFIRQELGNEHVRLDVWRYYARRLTLPSSHSASIGDEAHLRSVMRYWKGVRPSNPRGDSF